MNKSWLHALKIYFNGVFTCIFFSEKICIMIQIIHNYVPNFPIDIMLALVSEWPIRHQAIDWRCDDHHVYCRLTLCSIVNCRITYINQLLGLYKQDAIRKIYARFPVGSKLHTDHWSCLPIGSGFHGMPSYHLQPTYHFMFVSIVFIIRIIQLEITGRSDLDMPQWNKTLMFKEASLIIWKVKGRLYQMLSEGHT